MHTLRQLSKAGGCSRKVVSRREMAALPAPSDRHKQADRPADAEARGSDAGGIAIAPPPKKRLKLGDELATDLLHIVDRDVPVPAPGLMSISVDPTQPLLAQVQTLLKTCIGSIRDGLLSVADPDLRTHARSLLPFFNLTDMPTSSWKSPPETVLRGLLEQFRILERHANQTGCWEKVEEEYLNQTMGRKAWPIGLGRVGIHARTSRDKIEAQKDQTMNPEEVLQLQAGRNIFKAVYLRWKQSMPRDHVPGAPAAAPTG